MPGRSTHPHVVRSDRQQSPSPQRFGHDFSKIPIHSPVGAGHGTGRAPSLVAFAESGVNEPGIALPVGPRAMLESQLGSHFGDVRIHTGPSAIAATRRLGAAAYTLGRDIAFGDGFYSPNTDRGLRLLSHELTHVIQSRNTPKKSAETDKLCEGTEPLEQEARAASGALGRGKTTVRERLANRTPLCYPIYISSHGDPPYLAAAARFYNDWGYSPVHQGVHSIEEVVKDLSSQSTIEHVTIVSHANSELIVMEFLDGGPDRVLKGDWEVDTVDKLTNLERHLVDASTVDVVINYVETAHPGVVRRVGPVNDPMLRQFIWWIVEQVRAVRAGYPAAAGLRMKQTAKDNTELYRNRLLSNPPSTGAGSASGQSAVTQADLTAVENAVLEQAERWPWDKQPPKSEEVAGHEQRLKESPSASIIRVAQNPQFFKDLSNVQKHISDASWIEIQGCTAGRDKDYLKAVQRFFGGTAKPRVTAPDWYQVFGHFGWRAIRDNDEGAKEQWERTDTDVPKAFRYWFKIILKKDPPKHPDYHDLLNYLRQGHVLPLTYPGAAATARLLLLQGQELPSLLKWLSRHQYLITNVASIQQTFFQQGDFGTNVENTTVDWLEEHFRAPGQIALRPSPEYSKHIIEVK